MVSEGLIWTLVERFRPGGSWIYFLITYPVSKEAGALRGLYATSPDFPQPHDPPVQTASFGSPDTLRPARLYTASTPTPRRLTTSPMQLRCRTGGILSTRREVHFDISPSRRDMVALCWQHCQFRRWGVGSMRPRGLIRGLDVEDRLVPRLEALA